MNEHAVHMALRGQALPALPAVRRWENSEPSASLAGVEYAEEDFVPTPGTLFGMRVGGQVMDEGLYIIRWFGIANQGTQAISTSLRALLNRFPPGSGIPATDGSVVRVKGKPAPSRSQITNPPDYPGRAVSTVTIPLYMLSVNV